MLRASEKIFTIFFINTQPSNFLSIRIMAKKFFGWSGEQLRQMRIHQHPFTRTGQSGNGEGQGSGTYSLRVPPPAGQRSIQKCGGIQQQDRYSGETLLHSIIHDITATSPRTAGLKTSSGRPKRWNTWARPARCMTISKRCLLPPDGRRTSLAIIGFCPQANRQPQGAGSGQAERGCASGRRARRWH
jgi:hypothetical protein